MGVRADLAAHFRDGLDATTHLVVADVRELQLEAPTVAAVQIVRTTVERAPEQPLGAFLMSFDIWVIATTTDPTRADDALDDALDEVLQLIDAHPWMTWGTAEREVHAAGYAGYKITAQVAAEGRK